MPSRTARLPRQAHGSVRGGWPVPDGRVSSGCAGQALVSALRLNPGSLACSKVRAVAFASSLRATMWSAGLLTDSTPTRRPPLKQKVGESSGGRLAPQRDVLTRHRETSDLQLVRPLVAPEPGHGGVGTRPAHQSRRDAPPMIDGVLHGLEPYPRTPAQSQRVGGTIPDGRDGRVCGAERLVDDDPVLHRKAGLGCEFGVGDDPDADQDEIGREDPPVGRFDLADVSVPAVHLGHRGLEHETDAGLFVSVLEKLRHRNGERARHRPRCGLDHRDLGTGCRGRRREFEADEAGPDHYGSLEAGHLTPEGIRVRLSPQLQDTFRAPSPARAVGGCGRRSRPRDGRSRGSRRRRDAGAGRSRSMRCAR